MHPEKHEIENIQQRSTVLQIILGLIAYSSSIAPSMSIGFSAVALPPLVNENNPLRLNPTQASWFASIAPVATPLGCFLSGPISDRFGRKNALICVNVTTFLGWIILAIAYDLETNQYPCLLLGRIFTGLSTGLASMPAAVYMAEVSTPKLRGMFTTASAIFFAFGILLVYILGYIFQGDWGTISIISAIIPCCAMVAGLMYLPESPPWLVSKNQIDKASRNLRKIYGYKEYTQEIYDDVQALINNRDANKMENPKTSKSSSIFGSFAKKIRYLKRPTCFKPFVLILTYFFFQQFSGTFVIVFYAITIVQEADVRIDPYKAIVLVAFTRFVAALMVSYVSKKYGRRPPSILSGAGMTLSMVVLAIYLYLKYLGKDVDGFGDVPLYCLIFYFFTSTLGYVTIPFAMAAECFPAKIRGTATGLITCIAYIFNFIIVKIFPAMKEGLQPHGLFLFYGVVSLIGTIFIVFLLPETKGKTLAEIEEYFGKKTTKKVERSIIKTERSKMLDK